MLDKSKWYTINEIYAHARVKIIANSKIVLGDLLAKPMK